MEVTPIYFEGRANGICREIEIEKERDQVIKDDSIVFSPRN